jgi:hypothetical protein
MEYSELLKNSGLRGLIIFEGKTGEILFQAKKEG